MTVYPVYIGYYKDILLCASTVKSDIKKYMRRIRGLDKGEYQVYTTVLNDDSLYTLYGDFLLEKYDDKIYLTSRDIEILERDISVQFDRFTDMLQYLDEFTAYAEVGGLRQEADMIRNTKKSIRRILTKGKSVDALRVGIETFSPIFSKHLETYLQHVGYYIEDHELRERFLTLLNDEKS